MFRSVVQLKRICGVAVLAILMLALAPAISSVLGGANYAAWVNVCRTGPMASTSLAANNPDHPGGTGHLSAHCPYCALHADTLPTAPHTPAIPRDALPSFMEPQAFLQAPSTGHVWRHAPSRAPPRLS